ncbi:uncharacterized protein TRIVIDRAFT_111930 [Trichoderma virens Gv29-8]|uniref:Uncharacterized protein n=1 Tax=Hypocrea virens (strain Gv29-8 / FGSC 10586) TaxID=413071 RepID=G9MWS9_HYPVG|nr:uncharacterized protein TRIVIDRAFT_111930 [Trichoderma virens Gv29-8]EHK21062.1 hypothetical protein TRIVIDRAFT_111930 [Trichoderma virens Gv29-8]UKZ49133.1 hypothetical protein TrVGV298_003374 [Trichoderma virens]UKZ75661.1 hypothetical protein TrVFT333_003351 [Trichoderma virens FT-333]
MSAASDRVVVTEPERVYDAQPNSHPAMDAQQPHPETKDDVNMRGGDDGDCCPGRFCFIIPCPIPIDCCIFPCPC